MTDRTLRRKVQKKVKRKTYGMCQQPGCKGSVKYGRSRTHRRLAPDGCPSLGNIPVFCKGKLLGMSGWEVTLPPYFILEQCENCKHKRIIVRSVAGGGTADT